MTVQPRREDFVAIPERITEWTEQAGRDWGQAPIRLQHRLLETGLFSDENLADIIDNYPVENYSLIAMGVKDGARKWHLGKVDGLRGADLIDFIRTRSSLWLNLRGIHQIDPRFGRIFDAFLKELGNDVPGLAPYGEKMGVLISGPGTKVDYHADLPGQSLWQIRGEKTVYLYPNAQPYISERQLEDIAYDGVEKIPHDPAFESGATVLPLKPGEMLHWPLNAPHRVENGPMMNISVTTEYLTQHIKRLNQMNVANAIMRRRLGLRASGRPVEGPGYWAKAVLQAGFLRAGLLEKNLSRGFAHSFTLSKGPDGVVQMTGL